jgi:hypothetical protein
MPRAVMDHLPKISTKNPIERSAKTIKRIPVIKTIFPNVLFASSDFM